MGKEQIISKGKYALAQPANMVGVKQYLFVRDEDGKKRLLLRFENNRQEKCSDFQQDGNRSDSVYAKGALPTR